MGAARSQQLCEALQNLQQFYFWPNPVGPVAEGLLIKLEKEIMCPGTALREALQVEAQCLRSKEASGRFSDSVPVVYHMMSADCEASLRLRHIMQIKIEEGKNRNRNRLKIGEISPRTLALIVLNTVQRHVPVTKADVDAFIQIGEAGIRDMAEEISVISKNLYNAALGIAEGDDDVKASDTPAALTPQSASRKLLEAFTNMKKAWSRTQGKDEQPISRYFPDVQDLYDFLEAPGAPLRLPDICHKALLWDLRYTMSDAAGRRLARETEVLPPETSFYEPLKDLLVANMSGASPEQKVTVRISLTADDETMNAFICAYVRLQRHDSAITKNCNFKMFVVPVTRGNTLAWYIGRHDIFYERNILAPIASDLFLLPWVALHSNKEDRQNHRKSPEAQLVGTRMKKYFHSLLNNYIRYAGQTLNVKIWNTAVYSSKPEWDHKADGKEALANAIGTFDPTKAVHTEPEQVLPFFNKLEIGYNAEFARYCEAEKIPYPPIGDSKKIEEKFMRDRKFQAPEMKLRIARVGLDGKVISILREHNYLAYQEISLSNLPTYTSDDPKTFPPNPEDPWLEMYAKTTQPFSTKKSLLNQEPAQHVCRVELAVKNDDRFSILIDGVLFPRASPSTDKSKLGYQTIVVEKIVGKSGEHLSLPVQTFYPFGGLRG